MSKQRKPLPKTQQQLSQDTIQPYGDRGKALVDNSKNRALQRSVTNSDVKQFSVGLKDIDEAIVYYFNNVIKPIVTQNGRPLSVPVLYGSPERWVSVQKDGYYRDKNGKIQVPLIMYKRDSIEKNRTMGNKLDANKPLNFGVFEKKYTRKNIYDRFSALQNRIPVKEYYGVIIPDYVDITYNCVLFTEYVEQMNKLVEAINFASDAYWGDREKFQFRAMIDTYTPTVEVVQGQDRVVKTTFTIKLLGYIIPDTINAAVARPNKFFSKAALNFKLETAGTLEELTMRSKTPDKESVSRFFETPSINLTTNITNNLIGAKTVIHQQTEPSTTWVFNHNLNQKYPVITVYAVYDGEDKLILPVKTLVQDENTLTLIMPLALTGHATAVGDVEGVPPVLDNVDKEYILLNTVLDSNIDDYEILEQGYAVLFKNVEILIPPPGYPPLSISNFTIFINGMTVEPTAIDIITQSGSDLLIGFNQTLDYAIDLEKEIVVGGKLRRITQ